jgi:hypothetical protein
MEDAVLEVKWAKAKEYCLIEKDNGENKNDFTGQNIRCFFRTNIKCC